VSIRSSSNPELEAFHTPRKSSGVRDRPSSHIPTTRCRHLSGRFSNASASQAPVVLAASYAGPFSPAHHRAEVDETLELQSPCRTWLIRPIADRCRCGSRCPAGTRARRGTVTGCHRGWTWSDSATPLSAAGHVMIELRADAPTSARPGLSRTQPTTKCWPPRLGGSARTRGHQTPTRPAWLPCRDLPYRCSDQREGLAWRTSHMREISRAISSASCHTSGTSQERSEE
jgi:hypothetical protein